MTAKEVLDVLVMGAGPGGSTAGHLLARAGHDVLIVEKEDFPRFHIGESLLPCDLPLFARLGMDMKQGAFLCKQGAEFIDEARGLGEVYSFSDALPSESRHAYQVERATFDHALLLLAERAGARVELRTRVEDVIFGPNEVTVQTDRGARRARFLVDATGQDALLGRRGRSIDPLKGFGRGAVFCHFAGVSNAAWAPIARDGNIKVLIRDDGWGWMIPLVGQRVSVGFVSHVRKIETTVLDAILEESPVLQGITRGTVRSETRLIRNFSYKNRASSGPRYACVGDAACFLDPVFSSGVSLAMLGAERLADVLSPALHQGREGEPEAMVELESHMGAAYRSFGSLVHSFYNTDIVRNIFFAESPIADLRSGLISLLAGDVWRGDNRFQSMLLRSSRRAMPEAG
jgi:flavin-dependent dehydrogenase